MRITGSILLLFLFACAPMEEPVVEKPAPQARQRVRKTQTVVKKFNFRYAPGVERKAPPANRQRGRARLVRANPDYRGDQAFLKNTHEVRYFLSQYTSSNGRTFVAEALPRRDRYLPLIERVFADYGIPPELANVAFVESAFRPHVSNDSGAAGLWQFMKGTAEQYDLEVSFFNDERKDVFKSTVAAARYLVELHERFGDWLLVVAAYNTGPTQLSKAISENGTKDFFELSRKGAISRETSAFVAKFIALAMITRDLPTYGFSRTRSTG